MTEAGELLSEAFAVGIGSHGKAETRWAEAR